MVSNWTGSEGEAFQAVIDDFEVAVLGRVGRDRAGPLRRHPGSAHPGVRSGITAGRVRSRCEASCDCSPSRVCSSISTTLGWLDRRRCVQRVAARHRECPDGSAAAVYFKGNVNGLIWYTPAELESLGVAVPTDRDTFVAAADAAVAGDIEAFAVGGKDGWPLTQWADPLLLSVAGPETFLALQQGEIGWDDGGSSRRSRPTPSWRRRTSRTTRSPRASPTRSARRCPAKRRSRTRARSSA